MTKLSFYFRFPYQSYHEKVCDMPMRTKRAQVGICFKQGQLLEGVECHIYMYLYCFTFDGINLNRAFVIIVLFTKKI